MTPQRDTKETDFTKLAQEAAKEAQADGRPCRWPWRHEYGPWSQSQNAGASSGLTTTFKYVQFSRCKRCNAIKRRTFAV